MANTLDLVVLGAVAGAHGVRGEAKLKAFGDAEALCGYGPFLDEAGAVLLTPERWRVAPNGVVIASFREKPSREDVLALKGRLLHAPRAALPEPEAEEYYHADLIGLAVVDAAGAPLGRVVAVHDFGAGDLLEVRGEGAPGFYLPFTRAAAPEVDLAAGRLVADLSVIAGDEDEGSDETPDGAGR